MRFQRDLTTDELRLHLVMIHGMYVGDVKTREGLEDAHRSSHLEPDRPYYIDHIHDGDTDDAEAVQLGDVIDGEEAAEDIIEEWQW